MYTGEGMQTEEFGKFTGSAIIKKDYAFLNKNKNLKFVPLTPLSK